MATPKNQKQKAEPVADVSDIFKIGWVTTQFSKFAGNKTIRVYRDPQSMEQVLLKNEKGEPTPFTILANRSTKLKIGTNTWHRLVYEFIMGKTVEGGTWRGHPLFAPGKKIFTFENITAAARKRNLSRREQEELRSRVRAMSDEEIMQFGLLFGADGNIMTYDEVLDAIYSIIETPATDRDKAYNATHVKEYLDNPDFEYLVLTEVLMKKQIITYDNSVYKYNGQTVGISKDQITKWLRDNVPVFSVLRDQHLATHDVAAN